MREKLGDINHPTLPLTLILTVKKSITTSCLKLFMKTSNILYIIFIFIVSDVDFFVLTFVHLFNFFLFGKIKLHHNFEICNWNNKKITEVAKIMCVKFRRPSIFFPTQRPRLRPAHFTSHVLSWISSYFSFWKIQHDDSALSIYLLKPHCNRLSLSSARLSMRPINVIIVGIHEILPFLHSL